MLATLFAVNAANELLRFDSATPGTIDDTVGIGGLAMGETILGIDFRPSNRTLYAVSSADVLYTIDVATGAATNVATLSMSPTGTSLGIDFNPVADLLRLVSEADENWRVDPATGMVTVDTPLAYAVGDTNESANPNVVAAAYTNSFAGAASTMLFDIDSALDILASQNPPNIGTLTTVGLLGTNTNEVASFDISAADDIAYAALTAAMATTSQLFTVNLTTGATTLLGTIGGGQLIVGLSAAPVLVVTNTNDSGAGSLRDAITAANATVGIPETILFDIAGAGPHIIEPMSALPTITDPVVIDGTSEPDFTGTPIVVLDGSSAGAMVSGLIITAGDSTVQGLRIQDFTADGIQLDMAGENTIGGTSLAEGNTITANGGDGVSVLGGTGNAITANSIFANGGLGIDLAPDGVTANDLDDPDTGPNNLQNFPLLTLATSAGGMTTVQGTFNSTPSTQFTLLFFSNTAADASGNGEGQTFLGMTMVTTDAMGDAVFSATFPTAVPNGQFITATAIDPASNTSEFSLALEVQPTITITDDTVVEGNAGTTDAVFSVLLSSASTTPITVLFSTSDGSAMAPGDYAATSGTLAFAAGETSMAITVAVNGDVLAEGDETFNVNLSAAMGARITDPLGIGTIDEDEPVPTLSINDRTVTEGNVGTTSAVFTVTLSGLSATPVTVQFQTADVTATSPADYLAQSGTLTFAPGTTTQMITVAVNGDLIDEPNETFQVNLSMATGMSSLGDAQGIGTISDDDPAPIISIDDLAVTEGDEATTNAVFTVTLSSPSGIPVTVAFNTADGAALASRDYVPTSGTISFNPGETTQLITVAVHGETISELDENFIVNLTNAAGSTISDDQGVGVILNDDFPQFLVSGASQGGGPRVRVFNPNNGTAIHDFYAYDPNFLGGVTVATADFNNDNIADIVTGAGPGGGPHVRVFDGATGQQLPSPIGSFFAYDASFTGGVFVAALDMNADGVADVITGTGMGGGPHVRVFNGATGGLLAEFFAYDASFIGGVRVAVADVLMGGTPEIVTAPGPTGGPHIRVFTSMGAAVPGPSGSFFAYDPSFGGGVYVATGDVNGDDQIDIVTGAGEGGGPHVRSFNGATGAQLAEPAGSFFAYEASFIGGVRVATGNVTGDRVADIITGAGPGGTARLRVFRGPDLAVASDFPAYETTFTGGLFVAGTTSGLTADPLRLAGNFSAGAGAVSLARDQVSSELIAAAQRRLGVSLPNVSVVVTDLPAGHLGRADGGAIYLDRDAAGQGWFIDETPLVDEEFGLSASATLEARAGSAAAGRIDLLTVLAHEMGHLLGWSDVEGSEDENDLMSATLSPGTRRLSHIEAVERVFGQF